MTATAEKLVREIQNLPLTDLLALRDRVNQLVNAINPPPVTVAPRTSDAEFQAALDDLDGCTAGSGSGERLIHERQRDLEQEQAWLAAHAGERARG